MSIWVDRNTRLVVQGMGRDGTFHAKSMKEYGTKVVAGVSPTKAGGTVEGIPVFATLTEAVKATKANTSIIYVPAPGAADAIYEAIDSGVDLIVAVTEGVPVRDMLGVWEYLKGVQEKRGGKPRLIGPNCPGIISPGLAKVGIMPGHIHRKGKVGLVSRSGTLTYEVVHLLTEAGLGQSTAIGIGGDPINGTNFIDALAGFQADPETEGIVLMGEIGGTDEEEAARYIRKHVTKPVVAFIAGQTAPPGKRMGHAGAIISGGKGTAAEKIAAFAAVGVPVARIPSEVPGLLLKALAKHGTKPGGARAAAAPAKAAAKPKVKVVAKAAVKAKPAPARGAGKPPAKSKKTRGVRAADKRVATSKKVGGLQKARAKLVKTKAKARAPRRGR